MDIRCPVKLRSRDARKSEMIERICVEARCRIAGAVGRTNGVRLRLHGTTVLDVKEPGSRRLRMLLYLLSLIGAAAGLATLAMAPRRARPAPAQLA